MPGFLENALRHSGQKKGLKGKKLDNYVYGSMNNIGAMHGSKITAKGERMEAKYERDMQEHEDGDAPTDASAALERAFERVNNS